MKELYKKLGLEDPNSYFTKILIKSLDSGNIENILQRRRIGKTTEALVSIIDTVLNDDTIKKIILVSRTHYDSRIKMSTLLKYLVNLNIAYITRHSTENIIILNNNIESISVSFRESHYVISNINSSTKIIKDID